MGSALHDGGDVEDIVQTMEIEKGSRVWVTRLRGHAHNQSIQWARNDRGQMSSNREDEKTHQDKRHPSVWVSIWAGS